MQKQRESMRVACFLSRLSSTFDYVRTQILGTKELPSLIEVFSPFRQDTLVLHPQFHSSFWGCSALVSIVGGPRSLGSGCGRSVDSVCRSSGRDQGKGGRGRDWSTRKCTHCQLVAH